MHNSCSGNVSDAPTTSPPPSTTRIGPVLGLPMEDVKATYNIGIELGRGQFRGVTYSCTHKVTGEQFACKTIAKWETEVPELYMCMHHLARQPNIVELKGVYEDEQSVHLVTEFCTGGDLFDRIVTMGHYSERAAASLFRTIVEVIHTCHSMGVIHRDIKPENFLFLNNDENSPLKLAGFGTSTRYKPGEMFDEVLGSVFYVAPEVLKAKHGPEVDIWSAGVTLYILLSGRPPFWPGGESEILRAISKGQFDLSSHPWPTISPSAKDLITRMLNLDPKQRPTAYQVLNHPWMKEDGEAPDKPLDNIVLHRINLLRAMNRFHGQSHL